MLSPDLASKYNRPTPRYTSYPPANFFTEDFSSKQYRSAVIASNDATPEHISFYIHIPFCPRLCHYCACNAYPQRRAEEVERYMQALLDEIELVLPLLDPQRKLSQIHYGGGTPSAAPLDWIAKINHRLLSAFAPAEEQEVSIECHPAYLDRIGWEALADAGFNRISLGIQDFDPEVLRAVNREESQLPAEEIFKILRSRGVRLNLDLIYGLPLQSVESFSMSIRRAISLQPDRLVTFSYAHVPWVKPQQRILEHRGLPGSEEKQAIFAEAGRLLREAGYRAIGLDHFVRPEDALYIASERGLLHRNFQGYCTRETTGQVYAFGVTAISQLRGAYAQNVRDIDEYIRLVSRGELPIARGYQLTSAEQLASELIARLMCNASLDFEDLARSFALSVGDIWATLQPNRALLDEMQSDGLICYSEASLQIQPSALPLLRVVASAFDPLQSQMPRNIPTYSQAL